MPNKEVDMVSPLVLEEHLNDVADDFYFDFPMEDLEGNQLTEVDWDASLQHLELPSDDLIGGLSTPPFTVKIFDDNSLCRTSSSKEESKPKVKDSSQGSTETAAHRKIYHHLACEGGKDPTLFPNSSSVSVLESSNKLLLGYRLFIPVKRARSKRLRPPTLNPRLTIPFISSSERRKVRKRNPPPDGTETDEPQFQPSSPGVTRKCTHCEVTKTPQWREGPMGPKTLCNACGVRYRSGRLLPEYRPAASPTFVASVHSNLHRKVVEMRNKGGSGQVPRRATAVDSSSSLRPPQLGNNSNGCHRLSV